MNPPWSATVAVRPPDWVGVDLDEEAPDATHRMLEQVARLFEGPVQRAPDDVGTDGTCVDLGWRCWTREEAEALLLAAATAHSRRCVLVRRQVVEWVAPDGD